MVCSLPRLAHVLGVSLVLGGLAWPGGAWAEEFRIYWPRIPSVDRAEQFIVSVEGLAGLYDPGERGTGANLVPARGARVRMSQGYTQLWAWEAIVSIGQSAGLSADAPGVGEVFAGPDRPMEFGRLSVGGVLRFGDMRIPHLRGDIGVQWTRHAGDAMSPGAFEHELSVVPTGGVGYDRRLHHNVLIGATLSLSWVAVSTRRSRGFYSADAGVRIGVGW